MVYTYMYRKHLFGCPFEGDEPADLARCFFDGLYDYGCFMKALVYLVEKTGFGTDGSDCIFGVPGSLDPTADFEGVHISIGIHGEESITVSEETFFRWLRMACDLYVARHPESKQTIEDQLRRI